MAQIDNIVQVTISRQTAQVSTDSFDIPLLLVEMTNADSNFTDRVRTYTGIDAVIEDLGVNHKGTAMARSLLSNDKKPRTFKIGKVDKQVGSVESYATAIAEVDGIDSTWYAAIAQSHLDADINEVAAYVQTKRKLYFFSTSSQLALQQAQTVVNTATVTFDITGAQEDDTISVVIAGERYQATRSATVFSAFSYVGNGTGSFAGTFSLAPTTGVLTITNGATAFTVTSARTVKNDVTTEVAASNISATDPIGMDIAQRLKAKGMTNTIAMFSNTADSEYPEASWVGREIVEVPGSNTWEYKSLAGTTVSKLSDTQILTLENRGYNYYIPVKGVNITRRGKVAEGEWIDVMVLQHWIHSRIQELIFYRMVNSKKIPNTQEGATIIEGDIRSVLALAVQNGGLSRYTVRSPNVQATLITQRAAREMGDFIFQGFLAGAVSTVVIRGTLEY